MEEMVMLKREFWQNKRVLLTGHTGFKGAWMALLLKHVGAEVIGIALPPVSHPNLFDLAQIEEDIDSHFCDIREAEKLACIVRRSCPEIVFHLAAQSLVRVSYTDPLKTFASNVMGTAHLLEALRELNSVRVALVVTTDKVYRNFEQPYPYREEDTLGGHDPYSASKAASELIVASYRDAFLSKQGVNVATARAGNVIGGGDWSEDRLIPDAVRAWSSGKTLEIRSLLSVRPWQHVLEPLHGYMTLAQRLWDEPELAGAYNFGPRPHEAATVQQVVELAKAAFGAGSVNYGHDLTGPHEAGWLALETAKARAILSVQPKWGLVETVTRTMAWYQAQQAGADARRLCLAEIADYQSLSHPFIQA